MEETKACSVCGKEFPRTTEHFFACKNAKDGLKARCKECSKKDNKINHNRYYAENKEKVNAKNLENYYNKHPKEVIPEGFKKCSVCGEVKKIEMFNKCSRNKDGYRGTCKACRSLEYSSNAEYVKKKSKNWYKNNKERAYEATAEYRLRNIAKYQENNKRYYKLNIDRMKENSKRSLYKRMENDDGLKLLQRCRKRMWDAVKNNRKAARTQELIGCTSEQLRKHIEKQFKEGMTWDNYGEWHVDHIIPCASFDFSVPEEQFKCFNYTNLQPLWAVENIRKGKKNIAS